ncbi:S41 family peptidase [Mitsuaria sp. GD03876]|uniref:S41 family peptidase n=1 Tax=Mitsuaria sp. GD03876 TaxID=2975399 RepID=UPI002449F267|nr:S41 family peptidase [Mitsuaria sp. GD03876]MDH0865237.1 S41 family peptidase [Mitsuaria sp. GD03876]
MTLNALALSLALSGLATSALAQAAPPPAEARAMPALSAAQRDAVVDAVKAAYRKSYVFPDKVPAILARLDASQKAGRYKAADPNELANLLSTDLREASHDGHAYLQYDPRRFAAASEPGQGEPNAPATDLDRAMALRTNHGLTETRLMPGNVRYLRVDSFQWVADDTGRAYDDAMRFLKGGDAVIVDLRGNGGGASEAVQYLVSHFLKPGTLEITFLEAGREPIQTRVLDHLPAGRMVGKPLYVLTDRGSASAAESFAYDVQQFRIGTLVGATTAGAANNNTLVPVAPGFMLSVSTGRPVHPVSGTNWEGAGVKPDLEVKPAGALALAHLKALEALKASTKDEERLTDLAWAITDAEAAVRPVTPPATLLSAAPGSYGKYVVTADAGGLWIARPGHPMWPEPRRLKPLTADGLFAVDGIDVLHVGFKPNAIELAWKGEPAPRAIPRL